MSTVEVASAYVALTTKMPGVSKDIKQALGGVDMSSAMKPLNAGIAGAVGGLVATVASKAMSTISSAVGGAISRVDTMNNFPKVMQNFGYSSEEAADSIQVMSDRLMGLPTSLNSMVGMVQQLAPLTGGLAEATDLSLAFNNALLAGGKDTVLQSNAMEQYTQMLAVGAVDMAAWRSVVTAMPGQINQMAESLLGAGNGAMDLYAAMKEGDVTFDAFNEAILDLNENGTGAFASFEEQARSATDGIATGQANLNTAITRGLANLIAKFHPQIMGVLGGITMLVNTAFTSISGLIDWASANSDWLAPLAIGLGVLVGGFVTMNAVATVAAAGGLAKWLAATKIATGVQAAFNLVMTANPIMLVVTAIGALVAGLVYFFTQTELGREIWANVTEAISAAVTWLWESVLQPVFTAIGEIFTWLYENIILPVVTGIMLYIGLWAALFEWLWDTVLHPIFVGIGAVFNWLYDNVIAPIIDGIVLYVQAWAAIFTWLYENVISPVFDNVARAFEFIYRNVISPIIAGIVATIELVGGAVQNVFGGIAAFIGAAFQAALGVVRGPINGIISLVNAAIRGLNSLSVKIPDWVPIVGGQSWGVNLPTIPKLADGAIVRGSASGTLALLGEAGRGRDEAVLPLPPGWQRNGFGGARDREIVALLREIRDRPQPAVISARQATTALRDYDRSLA